MLKDYYSSTVYRAAQFAVGMAATDAYAMLAQINAGRDPAKDHFAQYNGSTMFITRPGAAELTVEPGNWVVMMPDGTMQAHATGEFGSLFVAK